MSMTDKVFAKTLSVQKRIVFVKFLFSCEAGRFHQELCSLKFVGRWPRVTNRSGVRVACCFNLAQAPPIFAQQPQPQQEQAQPPPAYEPPAFAQIPQMQAPPIFAPRARPRCALKPGAGCSDAAARAGEVWLRWPFWLSSDPYLPAHWVETITVSPGHFPTSRLKRWRRADR
jgi:hypothetical protein